MIEYLTLEVAFVNPIGHQPYGNSLKKAFTGLRLDEGFKP